MSIISALQNTAAVGIAPARPATANQSRLQSSDGTSNDVKRSPGAAGNPASVSTGSANPANAAAKPAGFPSQHVVIDPAYSKAIFQVLNPETGALVQQIPSQEAVRRYERTAQSAPEAPAPEASGNPLKG